MGERPAHSPYRECRACERLINRDADAHHECQHCRNGGVWRREHWRHRHIRALRRRAR